MPQRKPPMQPGSRVDAPPIPEELNFSIETTTMRLKSLKLRRAEAAERELDERSQPKAAQPPVKSAWEGPAGRVRHDERGVAVWDWAAAAGETAGLSATNLLRKLDVPGLSIEATQPEMKAIPPLERDAGGGSDPYNQVRAPAGDPFRRNNTAGGDPYNRTRVATPSPTRLTVSKPAAKPAAKPAPAPAAKPGNSVLDQLLGKKK